MSSKVLTELKVDANYYLFVNPGMIRGASKTNECSQTFGVLGVCQSFFVDLNK